MYWIKWSVAGAVLICEWNDIMNLTWKIDGDHYPTLFNFSVKLKLYTKDQTNKLIILVEKNKKSSHLILLVRLVSAPLGVCWTLLHRHLVKNDEVSCLPWVFWEHTIIVSANMFIPMTAQANEYVRGGQDAARLQPWQPDVLASRDCLQIKLNLQ